MSPVDRVYVGATTHSSPSGITAFDLTIGEHGPQLVARAHVSGIVHPTFLALHPNGSVLYAVSETVNGEIVVLRVDGDDLAIEQRVPSCGDGPCHLSTDGRHLVVANYGSGSAGAYTLTTDGRLDELVWTAEHRGNGPHHRQDGPHAHCVVLDPHRASVHVVDLGIDRVVRYDADDTGFHHASETTVAPGAGPRHLAFHPSERIAFVICELDNTVVVLDTSGADPVVRSTMSTLPDDAPDDVPDDVTVDSLAAAVVVHPSGDRVYASNRGHDSIAVFAYGQGSLSPIGYVASGGRGPRDMAVDASGSVLLVANQHSDLVAGFDITGPGLPSPLGTLALVGEPTCVVAVGAAA